MVSRGVSWSLWALGAAGGWCRLARPAHAALRAPHSGHRREHAEARDAARQLQAAQGPGRASGEASGEGQEEEAAGQQAAGHAAAPAAAGLQQGVVGVGREAGCQGKVVEEDSPVAKRRRMAVERLQRGYGAQGLMAFGRDLLLVPYVLARFNGIPSGWQALGARFLVRIEVKTASYQQRRL